MSSRAAAALSRLREASGAKRSFLMHMWLALSGAPLRRSAMLLLACWVLVSGAYAAEPMVVTGNQFSAYLAVDGTVWTWGKNSQGQLGRNDSALVDQLTPVMVPGLNNVIGISAGFEHCLAVKADGTVWAWGRNAEGQLGQGYTGSGIDHPVQVTMPGTNNHCTAVAAGGYHSLAIAAGDGGTLFAWGQNDQGQIGKGGTSTSVQTPYVVTSGARFIAAGKSFSMYIDAYGQVYGFGDNTFGQLGNNAVYGIFDPKRETSKVAAIGATNALTLSCGLNHTLMTNAGGVAYAWGSNEKGQIGNNSATGTGAKVTTPTSLRGATRVVAGGNHSMLVTPSGSVYTWGDNTSGQCRLPTSTTLFSNPQLLDGLSYPQQRALFGGIGDHTLFVLDNGQVQGWGKNDAGQLGTGVTGTSNPSAQTAVANWSLEGMIAIDAGYGQSIALKADGTVWTWGSDEHGELGNDLTSANKPMPVQVTGFSHNIVAIAAGSYHCLALDSNGRVWSWGRDGYGQLGDDTAFANKFTPVLVGLGTHCRAIGAGGYHSLAVTSNGSVVAWGYNDFGQLGNNSNISSATVVNVSVLRDVWQVTGGWGHSLALKADGNVWSWGDDYEGSLGDDVNLVGKFSPVTVTDVSGVMSIAGGQFHSLAARVFIGDNSWGQDLGGQLGDNTAFINQPTPQSIANVSNLKQVSAGGDWGDLSLGLRVDGTVFSFGRDKFGGLGDDAALVNQPTPVRVAGLDNIVAVAAGDDHGLALSANGKVVAWGSDSRGQLGDDANLTNQPTPVTVFPNWLPTVSFITEVSIFSPGEPGGLGKQGSLTFMRTGATTASLPVNYSISGTAINGGDYTALSGSAIIPAGSSSVTITINPLDDQVAESTETVNLTLASAPGYNIGAANMGTVRIGDNDVAGVVVSVTSGLITTEAGGTASFNVRLTSQPTANVSINFISSNGAEGSISPTTLTFTPSGGAAWNFPQTVTITGVNDFVQDGNIGYQINNGGAISSDGFYSGKTVSQVLVTNQDNDVAGFTVSAISGATTEAGTTATFTIRLTSQPTANVTVGLTSENTFEGTVSPTSVTFTPATGAAGGWNQNQTVTVTGVNDDVADGNITYRIITGAPSTSDLNYGPLVVPDVTVINNDNDSAGVTIVESGGSTNIAEGGATDAFTVVLKSQPTANVSVSIVAGSQCSVGQTTLNFTTGNWNLPQTVTVTAIDDPVAEGAQTGSLTHSVASSDAKYNGGGVAFTVNGSAGSTVTANITDNDVVGFTLIQSGGTTDVSEAGGSDTYTIRLNTQPSAAVSLTLNADAQVRVNGSASAVLAFSATAGVTGGWDQPQMVTITAVNDALVEGLHLGSITGTATGGGYTGVAPPTVSASVTDNDAVSISVSPGTIAISEAGTRSSYTVALGVQPGSNVTVVVNADPQTQVSTDNTTFFGSVNLTFTNGNFASAQTVYVKAIDDLIDEGTHSGTITHTASGSGYTGVAISNVVATITDNDTAGVTVTAMAATVTEAAGINHSSTYTVKLNTQPSGPVTVALSPNAQQTISPSTLTFTASGAGLWSTAQTVTVTALDDTAYEGAHSGLITHTVSSGDARYNGTAVASISPSITDNDILPTVTFATVASSGAESVASRNLTVSLTFTAPTISTTLTTTVNYSATGGTATGGGVDYTLASASLSFSPGQVQKSVPLTIVNDALDEIDETVVVTLASPVNAALGTATHTYTINDDDTAGITIVETGAGTTVAEGGTGDTYTVVLNSQPTSNVTITISGMTSNGVTATSTLTFSPSTPATLWSTPQTVTVAAVDDGATEGTLTETLVHTVSTSSDPNYPVAPLAMRAADVVVTILDNDTAGVTIIEGGGGTAVTEGTVNSSYTVRLNTDPLVGTVTVTAIADGQMRVCLTNNGTFSSSVALTFTSGGGGNWATPQTIHVRAFDDAVVEGAHSGVIAHTSLHNSGITYTGLAVASVTATITDNDVPAVTISDVVEVVEGGTTDTYRVMLDRQPSANVVVNISPDAQVSVSPNNLLFTTANWSSPQDVTVTAVDDAVAEDVPQTGVITHSAQGGSYTGISIPLVTTNITDNDTPAIILNQSGGSTMVTESGTSDSYAISLATKPQAGKTVTISVGNDASVSVSPLTLTFTAADYNTPQTVMLSAVNDLIAQGTHTGTVTHVVDTVGSPDPLYAGLSIPDVVANVTDNDSAGILVTQSGGSTAVSESGASDTISVQLTSQPSATVTVTMSPDAQVRTSGSTPLIFTASGATAWNIPQTVTITAVDNQIADGLHSGVITLASSGVVEYGGLSTSVTAQVTDNDVAGVTVLVGSGVSTAEDGSITGTYSVQLATMPTAPVTIAIAPNAQVSVSPSTLFFTAAGGSAWNVPQTVTVTAVDEQFAEGPHSGLITQTAASGDAYYQGIATDPVAPTIIDNDQAGVIVSQTSGLVTSESGGTATFNVSLASKPLVNVLIGVSSSATSEGTVSPALLTFSPSNWNAPQTVTATGVHDFIADGNQVYTIVTAAASAVGDGNYNGMTVSDIAVTNTDIDTAGIQITQSGGSSAVTEAAGSGNIDTYSVVLSSLPTGTVTVSLSSDGQTSISPATFTFTAATGVAGGWDQAQMVTITGIDDGIDEPATHSGVINHNASGGGYNVVSTGLSVSITDNPGNAAGFSVSTISAHTTEGGGTATTTVRLDSQPVANVTVILASSNTAEGAVSPSTLTFTPSAGITGGWDQPQLVTVTGVDDRIDDGNSAYQIEITAVSGDANYNVGHTGLLDVAVVNDDDDIVGVSISTTSLITTEASGAGSQTSFVVALNTQPTANVTVALNGINADETSMTPSSLIFTSLNWNVGQTVTISGVDDQIDDGNISYTITPTTTSTDSNYQALAGIQTVQVTNVDDDTAGITLTPITGLITTESGGAATFTIRLDTEPTANVTIGVLSNDLTAGTASPSTVTFTSLDWNIPQTVTITGVDDVTPIINSPVAYSIVTAQAASTDAKYSAINPADVAVSNSNNDVPGILISESGSSTLLTEASGSGNSDTYTITLTTMPLNDVAITVNQGASSTVSPGMLLFTTANWNTPQTVTVSAVDDAISQGTHTSTISHSIADAVSGQVSAYAGLTVPSIVASISDDDTANFAVSASAITTTEIGGTGTFTVALTSAPTAPVVINLSSSNLTQGTVLPSTMTFSPFAYGPQTVTVSGADGNASDDGNQPFTVLISAAVSSDLTYNNRDPADVSVTNLAVNNQPTLATMTLGAVVLDSVSPVTIAEDVSALTVNLTGIGAGQTGETFALSNALTVTASSSNPAVIPNPLVSYAGLSTGSLVFTPAANANGTATITVTVDDGGSTANGGQRVISKTFTVIVTSVNDAPIFGNLGDVTVAEDASLITISGWATAINPGPLSAGDEVGQVLLFDCSTSDDASFVVLPSINASTGDLTFRPAQNANTTTSITVSVTLSDDGGGASTSVVQTFGITISPVNDPPAFTPGPPQVIAEDGGPQIITPWVTNIAAGPDNEDAQNVSFVITVNDNPGLFSALPAIDSAGTLTYTGLADAGGVAHLTYHALDNLGGVSGDQLLTITINPVNDAPVTMVSLPVGRTVPIGATRVISNSDIAATDVDSALPAPVLDPALIFTLNLPPGNGTLFRNGLALAVNDTFTQQDVIDNLLSYTHNGGTSATDGFAFTVSDSGIAAGTVLVSPPLPAAALPSATSPIQVFNIIIDRRAPVVRLTPNTALPFTEDGPAVLAAITASVSDFDSVNFAGGLLTVDFASGATAADRIGLELGGAITANGSTVSFNGGGGPQPIGTYIITSTATGSVFTLSGLTPAANPISIAALLQALTYQNVSAAPSVVATNPVSTRILRAVLIDDHGDISQPALRDVAVTSVNDAPVITPPSAPVLTSPGFSRLGNVVASDIDGDALIYIVLTPPTQGSLVIDAATGAFSYTAIANPAPSDAFTIEVSDGIASVQQAYTVTISVVGQSRPTIISPAPMVVWGGGTFLYTPVLATTGLANPAVIFELQGDLPGATFNPVNGSISWPRPPSPGPVGYYRAGILVIDQVSRTTFYQPLLLLWLTGAPG
jgi:alpha-tubulin suppressor-like RCC1 family protein